MRTNNQHYLVVTALGSDRLDALETFTRISKQSGCNVLDSKLTRMGREFTLSLHLAGTWNTIAKLETALPPLAQQFNFVINSKRTLAHQSSAALTYQVQVFAQDRAGILNELAQFFVQEGIAVEQMDCESYRAKNNTTLTNIHFLINIPAKQHIATMRERFMVYCEERNLDAAIEPYKNL